MNLSYVIARIARRLTPRLVHNYLLRRSLLIRAGLDTSEPESSAKRYKSQLSNYDVGMAGKSIILFGFGGSYAVAAKLLSFGAKHVALVESRDILQTKENLIVAKQYPEYLSIEEGRAIPESRFISVHHGVITSNMSDLTKADIILSNSVMEHVDKLPGIIDSLSKFTNPAGVHLHFIHIGDHFGKHPFEMLTYSEFVWKRFLNPPSNLNRLRKSDYYESFSERFNDVRTEVHLNETQEFIKAKHRIREEFISGSDDDDSVIVFSLFASGMKNIP